MQKFTISFSKSVYIILIIFFIINLFSSCIYYINPGHIDISDYKIFPSDNKKSILETPLATGYYIKNPVAHYFVEYPPCNHNMILFINSVEISPEYKKINLNFIASSPISSNDLKKISITECDTGAIFNRTKDHSELNKFLLKSITCKLIKYEAIKKWDVNLPQTIHDDTPFIGKGEGRDPPENKEKVSLLY
jgi:hypothetical protein